MGWRSTPLISGVWADRAVPYVEELSLRTREYGPQEEPERFVTRYILNDGTMTQEAYDALMRKAAQAFNNRDVIVEQQQAAAVEHDAHQRSIQEWEAKMKAAELDHASLPRGPPPGDLHQEFL